MEQNQTEKEQEEIGVGEIYFSWKIPEYVLPQRSRRWYFVMLGLAVFLIIYSIFTANFLFALIIIIAIYIIFLRMYHQPKELIFQIAEEGILVGNTFYEYSRIKNFYIIYNPPVVKKLFFTFKGLSPDISIPLEDMNPLVIRKKLLEYIDEDLEKEYQSIDDQLETILKL
ncbi:MAG TPA: hypothetical protein ENN28_00805 [Candidatus Uhrbacteria bacterium]|nr:hypothetical protein [Candidatus Uhrbacteria bacterium]